MGRYGNEILLMLGNCRTLVKFGYHTVSVFFSFFNIFAKILKKSEKVWYGNEILPMLGNFQALVEKLYFRTVS